jgi:RNA polymerase sigma-70 factor (ECF subfamily)
VRESSRSGVKTGPVTIFKNLSDKQSIRKIRLGDIQAFEEIFRKYYAVLCQWAYRYLKDKDSSEEVVQDLFYHIWRDRSTLTIHTSAKSYLYKAVSNNCNMILKKQIRRTEIETELARNAKQDQSQPADLLETNELREVVEKTLGELPERPATIFRMSRYEGKKYREIAEELSISVKTVESNMGKALELFRKNLQEYL